MRSITLLCCAAVTLSMGACTSSPVERGPDFAVLSNAPGFAAPDSPVRAMGGEPVPIWVSNWAAESGSTISIWVQLNGPSEDKMTFPVVFKMTSDDTGSPSDYIEDADNVTVSFEPNSTWATASVTIKGFAGARKNLMVIVPGNNPQYKMHATGMLYLQDAEIKPPKKSPAAP